MVLTRQSGGRRGDEAVLSVRAVIDERSTAGLLSLMLVALIPPLEIGVMAVPFVAGLILAACAIRYRDQHSLLFVIVFASAFLVLGALLKELFTWPWHLLIPLVIAAIAARVWRSEARLALGWRSGKASARLWLAAIAISILTTGALVIWVELFEPDLEVFRAMVPRGDLLVLISAALGFALLNATMEELIWRGGIQSWLGRHTSIWLAILIQALSFGALHWAGFPSGWSGVALAIIYGVILGWLRHATGGLSAPIVAHILADLTIFLLVLGSF
ncbi:lysostaphin resistance A-like protein [Blastomonas sp.]|uniref:CPBP family intramembrane glutamic endopeptidase n=1 Tax=Blastomonas sp. TaxID=1909299 RepID=UPI003593FE45